MAQISLNNGREFIDATEAAPLILERGLWDAVVSLMDDATREQVHAELAPCSEEDFLKRYLALATEDLVIG